MTQLMTVSLVEAIAADIRSRILRGAYPADASFKEVEVAAEYEVARPTAKAAIEKLVSEALLVRRSNKTARIVTLTPEDVGDIYKTRALLEKAALLQLAETRSIPAGARAAQEELERITGGSDLDIVGPTCVSTWLWWTAWTAREPAGCTTPSSRRSNSAWPRFRACTLSSRTASSRNTGTSLTWLRPARVRPQWSFWTSISPDPGNG